MAADETPTPEKGTREQAQAIIDACGDRPLIVVAGMPRSGSTLLYNIARLCLGQAGHRVLATWIGDDISARSRHADCLVIKIHDVDELLRARADRILTSYRDLRDVVCSIRDMNWVASSDEAAGQLPLHLERHAFWGEKAALNVKYETMIAETAAVVDAVAAALGLTLDKDQAARIAAQATALPEPATDPGYDPVTLLHPRHRIDGSAGRWRDVLTPALIKAIEADHRAWLVAHGYVPTT